MYVSPTTQTAFYGGNVKLIGFKPNDLSENFNQIYEFAKKKELDFSILKTASVISGMDAYSIIASKDVNIEPYKLQGTAVSHVYKGVSKDTLTLKILSSILEAVDLINEKLKVKSLS